MASPLRRPVPAYLPRQKGQPPRIELNVLRLDEDGNSLYDEDFDPSVCHCFPSTSSLHIPSMLYDHINCPHHNTKHIQPAQDQVFAYPWTAVTNKQPVAKGYRPRSPDGDSLASGKLSIIEEEPQTPFVIRTAPPFANPSQVNESKGGPPFTAPALSRWESHGGRVVTRAQSVPSLTGYQQPRTPRNYHNPNPQISTPYVTTIKRRPVSIQDRNFDGRYLDPKDGQIYKFKVKYGKKEIEANRLQDSTIREEPEEYN
ncbi:uncharacterized protein LOC134253327 [Saccostrea cucullata]|uniref:uncharacterized protein LOC134253327 n=1 Tax=Saccostrea cuccullata TaxID=36930 RepID=UPI002ED19352